MVATGFAAAVVALPPPAPAASGKESSGPPSEKISSRLCLAYETNRQAGIAGTSGWNFLTMLLN